MWHGWERRKMHAGFVGKIWRKRALGKSKHRWEDITKMDIKEIEWEHGLD